MARTGAVVGLLNAAGILGGVLLAGGCLLVLTVGPWDLFVWFVDLRWPSTDGAGALWGFAAAAPGALLIAAVRLVRVAIADEPVAQDVPPALVEPREAS